MSTTDPQALVYERHIQTSIDHADYDNALFLAERLVACFPEYPRAPYLHAKAYYHNNQKQAAYRILEGQTYSPSQYLFARCCFDLDLLQEGEQALQYILQSVKLEKCNDGKMDLDGVELDYVHCLLGKICKRAGKRDEAKRAFEKALTLNPFLWTAYQGLCELGGAPEADDVFILGKSVEPPVKEAARSKEEQKTFKMELRSRKRCYDGATKRENGNSTETEELSAQAERSMAAANSILQELQLLGKAYRCLMKYECREALQAFSELSEAHLRTAWTLSQVARAYYEIARYPEAARYFREARELEPWRFEGLDLYGSCLWHMREEVELAFLAKEMDVNDRLAPQTWCIVGNLYSLRQEHDLAIKCFARAIQLDPYYYYAYTLTGFEYKMKEELDQAVEYFQKSSRIEPRPFNAWFGLGEIFYQQENYGNSHFMFEKAVSINPRNPIVHFHLGSILQKLGEEEKAVAAHQQAVRLDPKNPLYRLRLASAYADFKRYEEALAELQPLEGFTQIESNVYLLMGNVYKALGDTKNALMAYTKARDHRTSRHDVINEAIELLYSSSDESENLLDVATPNQ